MGIAFRSYNREKDFAPIADFLVANFQPENKDGNWLQPAWEYMHFHPYLDHASLGRIGIWEDSGKIVGVAHYESRLGEAFFELCPGYAFLKIEMLEYAEKHLCRKAETGNRCLDAFITGFDTEFERIAASRGYARAKDGHRPISQLPLTRQISQPTLPRGFRLKTLEEENDLHKIHRVLWRGFNHPGEPPKEGITDRQVMQSGPNYRKDLTIVVQAPNGDFVSYCGMWFEQRNKIAYVEPVATDPDYRRRGLGKAAVLEGIKRCSELGATVAYVGSDQEFYMSIGFERIHVSHRWTKEFDS